MIVLTFKRSLSQITYFLRGKLFFPQNSTILLLYANTRIGNKREYRISPEIVSRVACAVLWKKQLLTEISCLAQTKLESKHNHLLSTPQF